MAEKLHALTALSPTWQETRKVAGRLNRTLRGWANDFHAGTVDKAYRAPAKLRRRRPELPWPPSAKIGALWWLCVYCAANAALKVALGRMTASAFAESRM